MSPSSSFSASFSVHLLLIFVCLLFLSFPSVSRATLAAYYSFDGSFAPLAPIVAFVLVVVVV
jgi:hypothetical protein